MGRIVLVAVVALVSPLLAEQEEPKSKYAKEAIEKYEKDLAEARKAYHAYHAEALKVFIGFMDEARRRALLANDVDEAMRIAIKAKEAEELLKEVPIKQPAKLEIIAARWGAQDAWLDVTKQLQTRAAVGKLSIEMPEKAGFTDPKFGTPKSLVIVYAQKGVVKVAIFNYNQRVSLP